MVFVSAAAGAQQTDYRNVYNMTPGAIPFAASTGRLSQNQPAWKWDATNNNLHAGDYSTLSTYAKAYIPDVVHPLFDSIAVNRYGVTDGIGIWGAASVRSVAELTNTSDLTLLPSANFSVMFAHPPDAGYLTRVRTRDTDFIKLGLGNVDHAANDWIYWQNDNRDMADGHGGGEITHGYWANAWVQSYGGTLTNWHGWWADGYFLAGTSTPTNGSIFGSSTFIAGSGVDFARLGDRDSSAGALFRVDASGNIYSAPLTTGSVLYASASGKIDDNNAFLFFDPTLARLAVGTNTPVDPYGEDGDGFYAHAPGSGASQSAQAVLTNDAGKYLGLWHYSAAGGYTALDTNSPVGLQILTSSNTPMVFKTNGVERGRFNAAGALSLAASTTSAPPLNVGQGTAPSSPTNGDLWATSAGVYARINGITQQLSSTPTENFTVAASDETTALTTGTAKVTWRMPYAFTVTGVRCSLTTAQASGSIFTVDINEGGTSILSTKVTIDNTELTSTTAATPPVISDASLADDASMTIDIDQIGTSGAAGLKCALIGHQ